MDPTGPTGLGSVLYDLIGVVVRLRPRELSLTANNVLSILQSNGPARLGELAVSQVVSQPAMTATVDQLTRMGLVQRMSDPNDGRAVVVSLTPEGARFRERQRTEVESWVDDAIRQLGAGEAKVLDRAIPVLRHLVDALMNVRSPRP
jgi:DNA-binding MarR family transcriptional regulator